MSATWPAVLHARSDFLSGGAPGHGEASPGDHLQTLYHLWLVGHQLEHGRAPWRDPYSFRPEAGPIPNFAGWPFGLAYWPLSHVFGLVAGWNVLQLLIYTAAGLLALAWLRELGLPRGPALAGGLAFAIAPYRVEQSVGHLLGPISIMLPLALWAFERSRRGSAWWLALAGAAIASIPLSGQVHLALGAIPFFLVYAAVRGRERRLLAGAGAGAIAAVAAGALVRETVIKGSTESSGRSLDQVTAYSARWGDLVARHVDHARSEQFAFLGWATPLLALAGLALLLRTRRFGLAVILGLGALVPILLALGTRFPLYSPLWHALPPFRFPRVPERLLPIGVLCLAALLAFALARLRGLVATALVLGLVAVDLHARVYGSSVPGDPDAAAAVAPGRLLELPVFDPGIHYGSVYLWYDTVAQAERPGGYSTTAPKPAKAIARRLERLNCGDWSGNTAAMLDRLGVTTVGVHTGLFLRNSAVPDRLFFARRGLVSHGWMPGPRGTVTLFRKGSGTPLQPSAGKPGRPVFCQGWYGDTGLGRDMSEEHAPFWVYGPGSARLRLTAAKPLAATFTVNETVVRRKPAIGPESQSVVLPLGPGWNVLSAEVPHLLGAKPRRVGLHLDELTVTSPSRGSRNRRTGSSP